MTARRTQSYNSLVEAVLLELDMKSLLFAQGVCKVWKEAMERSSKIQEALFFKPIAVKDCFFDKIKKQWIDRSTNCPITIYKNPLLHGSYMPLINGRPFLHKGSCRKIFLSQPALRSVSMFYEVRGIDLCLIDDGSDQEDFSDDECPEDSCMAKETGRAKARSDNGVGLRELHRSFTACSHQDTGIDVVTDEKVSFPIVKKVEAEKCGWKRLRDNSQLDKLRRALR